MKIELDRRDIAALIRGGCVPMYEIIEKIPEDIGHFIGGFVDDWKWESMEKIIESPHTDEELYQIYELCKKTWQDFCEKHHIRH